MCGGLTLDGHQLHTKLLFCSPFSTEQKDKNAMKSTWVKKRTGRSLSNCCHWQIRLISGKLVVLCSYMDLRGLQDTDASPWTEQQAAGESLFQHLKHFLSSFCTDWCLQSSFSHTLSLLSSGCCKKNGISEWIHQNGEKVSEEWNVPLTLWLKWSWRHWAVGEKKKEIIVFNGWLEIIWKWLFKLCFDF